ncbi:MAG: hypothetical protein IIY28_10250 [Lachnospiraceae bacterium]|nr:hypothetical protein [Lachnospiraceae bacterium]
MKKQLAFLLAMVMMLSLACVPASAEDIILEEAAEETVLEPGGEAAPLPANEESVEPEAEQTGKTVASAADEESVVPRMCRLWKRKIISTRRTNCSQATGKRP